MTLDLFKTVTIDLAPTPSKFHYIFNLKDISRVFQGILQSQPGNFKDKRQIVRLWRHELERSFCDRMVSEKDVELVRSRMKDLISKNFQKDIRTRPSNLRGDKGDKKDSIFFDMPLEEYVMRNPILFGDFRQFGDDEPRTYEDLLDYQAVMHLFQEILDEFNETYGQMNLVLFNDCLDHLTRVHRTFRLNR